MPHSNPSTGKIKWLFALIFLLISTGIWTFILVENDETTVTNLFNSPDIYRDEGFSGTVSHGGETKPSLPDEFAQYYETLLSHQILLLEERAGIFTEKSEFVDEIAAEILSEELVIQMMQNEEDAAKFSYEILVNDEFSPHTELAEIQSEKQNLLSEKIILNAPVSTQEEGVVIVSRPEISEPTSLPGSQIPLDSSGGDSTISSEKMDTQPFLDEKIIPKIFQDNKFSKDNSESVPLQDVNSSEKITEDATVTPIPVVLDENSMLARTDLHDAKGKNLSTNLQIPQEVLPEADLKQEKLQIKLNVIPKSAPTQSLFEHNDVIAFYGNPKTPVMGIIGQHTMEVLAQKLREFAAEYDNANGPRGVIPCFYLIYGTCWKDGDIGYLDNKTVLDFIEFAKKHDWLVVLDHQIGKYSVEFAVSQLLPFLKYDNVHLALDPEWKTENPMKEIGTITAQEINDARDQIAAFLQEHNLDEKRFLIIHQFNPKMIQNSSEIKNDSNLVELVHSMDGFGSPKLKKQSYDRNVQLSNIPLKSFKLFSPPVIKNAGFDNPMMSAQEVLSLRPAPVLIMLQ